VGGACGAYGEKRGVYRILVGKSEERDSLVDPGIDESIIRVKEY
jgi:hypothetical protein